MVIRREYNTDWLLPIMSDRLRRSIATARERALKTLSTGSRKYFQDPTVFHGLSRRIISLAFQSIKARQSLIHVVQDLILLRAWPVPVRHLFQDKIHTISGACIQLALQIGLHVAGVGQDFVRELVQAQAHEQAYRAILWRYCLIVCQRSVESRHLNYNVD